ncbi:MAG: hypothetical protein AVDCRST_MAG85-2184, partial [uncultured Solirubrobacteraceae bacterium]
GQEGLVRGLLLQVQPAVLPGRGRALRDLPAQPSRGSAAAAAAALHVPSGASRARRLGLPDGPGAGRPAPV